MSNWNNFKKVKDEIIVQLLILKHLPQNPEKKFILFARGRSGSGLLRRLINSHPDIYCDDEIFLQRKAVFPRHYLNNKSRIAKSKIFGYKAKLTQLENQYSNRKKILEHFFSDDFKIIYLRRKNIFRQAVSGMIGGQRQIWHDTETNPLAGNFFYIDVEDLLNSMNILEEILQREQEILDGKKYHFVCYEDDLLNQEDHQSTMDKVFEYLDVETVPVNTKIVRTTTDDLSDFIENDKEVLEAVKNSKYSKFLE